MNWQQHDELQQLTLEAEDRLRGGEGRSGTHYELMNLIGKYGLTAMTREEAVEKGQRLCDEFIASQLAEEAA